MSKIVVYESSKGHTKQYAQWIAKALNCQAISTKEMTEKHKEENDTVIFGGWLMGNMIMGYDKIKAMNIENLVVFAVGASLDNEETRQTVIETNKLGQIPFFYMPGGMQFSKLNFFVRFILKKIKKSIAKKENKTPSDEYMAQVLGTDFDETNPKYIKELVASVTVNGCNS